MKLLFKSHTRRLLADVCTPVQLYLHMRDHFPETLLFETATEHASARSYICADALAALTVRNGRITKNLPNGITVSTPVPAGDAMPVVISDFLQSLAVEESQAPAGVSGIHGYICYDALRYMQYTRSCVSSADVLPDVYFGLYRYVLCLDHRTQELFVTEHYPANDRPLGTQLPESFVGKPHTLCAPFAVAGEEHSDCSDAAFLQMAAAIKTHCYRGDIFQAVISRSFSARYRGDDFNIYRQLRSLNPSPYMFYCDYGSYRLLGASPEAQLVIKNGEAKLHPIAGTYCKTGDAATDDQLALALLKDPKENAEHVMLVDLARNDLSHNYETITVARFKEIKQYSHLIHMVSEVAGTQPVWGRNSIHALFDCFPAGTLSGAPRLRAMQLIQQYEYTPRGYYGGCIGHLGFDGSVNMAIMIRSLLSKDHRLHYRAGAGIVAASEEAKELEEVNNKLRAIRTAIARANQQS